MSVMEATTTTQFTLTDTSREHRKQSKSWLRNNVESNLTELLFNILTGGVSSCPTPGNFHWEVKAHLINRLCLEYAFTRALLTLIGRGTM